MIRIIRILRAIGGLFSAMFSSVDKDLEESKATLKVIRLEIENRQLQQSLKEKASMVDHWKSNHDLAVRSANGWKAHADDWKAKYNKARDEVKTLSSGPFRIFSEIAAASASQKSTQGIVDHEFVEKLLRLCHPDRHSGSNELVSNEVTKRLLDLRKELKKPSQDVVESFFDDLMKTDAARKANGRKKKK